MALKFDIQIENLRRFFDYKVAQMTPAQREKLPSEILFRLFNKEGKLTKKPISFLEQIYVLTQSGMSNFFLQVEDVDNGVGVAELEKFKRKQNARRYDLAQAEKYLSHGNLILIGKDVADWYNQMNGVSLSGAMNYALKLKGTSAPKMSEKEVEFAYVCSMFAKYESNKKKIIHREQMTMPDLYVLLYLADDKEKNGSYIYKQAFIDATNSSKILILRAFRKLVMLGYINRFGAAKKTTYKITYLGKSAVSELFRKYILP